MDNILLLAGAFVLIILNGFFVAAEFALVKVRPSRMDQMVREQRAFSKTAQWLAERLDKSLSACQLGITMASLGLGWVGEPAFSALIEPVLHAMGISDPAVLKLLGFGTAFLFITALHLVVGEQFPKIYAIRRPEAMLLWCAATQAHVHGVHSCLGRCPNRLLVMLLETICFHDLCLGVDNSTSIQKREAWNSRSAHHAICSMATCHSRRQQHCE